MSLLPVLAMRGVSFTWPGAARPTLHDCTLELAPGEGVALLGRNGAGKTTLLRLAMALIRPTSGEIELAGAPTRHRAPEDLAHQAGFLFQAAESRLFERTVRDEVAFGLRQLGRSETEVTQGVTAALRETGLEAVADSHPYDLPVPTRRLVALAGLLAPDPSLLLLDEPTAGLDRATRGWVRDALLARRARGTAVLAATHDGELAMEALERGLVLDGSRIVGDAPIAELLGSRPELPAAPTPARIAVALGLRPASLRAAPVAAALAEHCRSQAARVKFASPDSPSSPS
jgi:energy-coupling factor transport system ATP-binding protein